MEYSTCRMFSRSSQTPTGWPANLKLPLKYVAEAERFAEATHTKWLQAETLRLRGDLLQIVGDSAGAETSFRDAITLAQQQGATLFGLRASASLACLLRDQGRHNEAGEVLVPISEWFTEGFEAPDLTESKAHLIPQDRRPC